MLYLHKKADKRLYKEIKFNCPKNKNGRIISPPESVCFSAFKLNLSFN